MNCPHRYGPMPCPVPNIGDGEQLREHGLSLHHVVLTSSPEWWPELTIEEYVRLRFWRARAQEKDLEMCG